MRIAVIGSGISGLTCAYLLNQKHDVTVFESADRIGGHTATVEIQHQNRQYQIDTGFIVYNDWTYPNFIKLLNQLNVESQATEMSFSVKSQHSGIEYGGANLGALFAQKRNIFKPKYIKMLLDILRFNKEAIQDLEQGSLRDDITLGEYLEKNKYSELFASHYLVPMGSAIWSSTLNDMLDFPLLFFVRFFKNHGLLSVKNRPQWRVLKGGSSAYLKPLTKSFSENIHIDSKISHIERLKDKVNIHFIDNSTQVFDQVVLACHSDQALKLLKSPTKLETEILSAIPYRNNEVVLHTDHSILPNSRKAWSSWNYHLSTDNHRLAKLSYNMNILQGISSDTTFVVTLNDTDSIHPDKILRKFQYQHPVFTLSGMQAQNRWAEINGNRNTWFCGAYWKNGFHEDGCTSGIRVAKALGADWE